MADFDRSLPWIWRINKKLRGLQIKVFQKNTPAGNLVLLLTTTGRKSGLERVTPVQYEEHDGMIYVASARGEKADWYRNIIANPEVRLQIKGRQIDGFAEPITDPERIADFLEMRLNKHPLMVRMIMTIGGLPLRYNRSDLVRYAANRAMVTIHPMDTRENNCPGIRPGKGATIPGHRNPQRKASARDLSIPIRSVRHRLQWTASLLPLPAEEGFR